MGRVALVTGGTRGIGAAVSKALKKAGYNVAANYHGNDDAAKAFKKETKIPVFKWDVTDYVACEQGVVNVENEVGPVEVLVNNAGISRDAMLQKMSHEQWSEVIRTNLDSLFNMTRPVINGMRDRGFGRIVNISSINGQKGQLGLVNYCSAKSGFIPGPNSGIYSDDVETQVRQTMRNQLDNFEEAGLTFNNVVAANVYLDNVDDFARMNAVYAQYFQGPVKPARTTIQQVAPGKRDADANGSYPTLEQVSFVAVR